MATWLTTPFESDESGNLVMLTIRRDVEKFRNKPRFKFRIAVTWTYIPDVSGMPDESTSELMEQVETALEASFSKDPVAVLTGIYTGDGTRDYLFHTANLHVFQYRFNEALATFPVLPLSFYAEEDPLWEEYAKMLALAEASERGDEDLD